MKLTNSSLEIRNRPLVQKALFSVSSSTDTSSKLDHIFQHTPLVKTGAFNFSKHKTIGNGKQKQFFFLNYEIRLVNI